ncbi:heparan-alpha-glucosaminide N-acetyltransferase [Rhizobium sp. Leaf341]|uniref:heparan-alpha-glucosaminide N-acetyltransferase n=1 Tax=Rhizobium sp. Leaf341 TaxID=1736344 RepID=UPI0009E71DF8|nr:heparan-alpha-glucosaminide N-acetyltransferase [Rhizobium sp. Leaf341]
MSLTHQTAPLDDASVIPPETGRPERHRLGWLDVVRGIAILAMASYHFSWDLEHFGYLAPGTVGIGVFKYYARGIASTFLFLAGFSLVLGHFPHLRRPAFLKRFVRIVAAAVVISIATWYVFPAEYIFFGILHAIAAASLIGILFLRLPVAITLAAAIAAFAAPLYLRSSFFDAPALLWVGLSETLPRSNDYVPLLPWLAPFLTGIALGRIALSRGWLKATGPARETTGPVSRGLAFAGRHSLPIYLLHQPLLYSVVALAAMVYPAPRPDPRPAFQSSCMATCTGDETQAFCSSFCGCTLDRLVEENLLDPLDRGQTDVEMNRRVSEIAGQCTMKARE